MRNKIFWIALFVFGLCLGEQRGKLLVSSFAISNKWITFLDKDDNYICAGSSSIYQSSSLKDECRWKAQKTSIGFSFINSQGKYLSGNVKKSSPGLQTYKKSSTAWKLIKKGSDWTIRNVYHLTFLSVSSLGLTNVEKPTSKSLWTIRLYKAKKCPNLKTYEKYRTCIKSESGKYLAVGSSGILVEFAKECNKFSQWTLKRTSDGRYTIQSSHFKQYLVTVLKFTFGLSNSPKDGKWLISSVGNKFVIMSGSNFYIADSSISRPSTVEKQSKASTWRFSKVKIYNKDKIASLHPKQYDLSLFHVKTKKYLTSVETDLSLSKKTIDSLWLSVPVGKKPGKHYLVNFEGKYLVATSTSVVLSFKKTSAGLWKIEEVNKKNWRLKNIHTKQYLHYSHSKFVLSFDSNPDWVVFGFTYSDPIKNKISKPFSLYNFKSKTYIASNAATPEMGSEAIPLTIQKYSFYYFIKFNGRYLSFSSLSKSAFWSDKQSSGALFKIYKNPKGYYEFISFGNRGSRLAVSSSGLLVAANKSGKETQWKLSAYKQPEAEYQKALENKTITFYGYYHKYLTEINDKIELTKLYNKHHSNWKLEPAENGYYYVKNDYSNKYLARNNKGLFLSSKEKIQIKIKNNKGNWIIQASDNSFLRCLNKDKLEFNAWYNTLANWLIKQAPTPMKTAEKLERYQLVSFIYAGQYLSYNEETKTVYYSKILSQTSFWQLAWINSGYYSLQTVSGKYFLATKGKGVYLYNKPTKKSYWNITESKKGWMLQTYEESFLSTSLTIINYNPTTVFSAVDGVKEYKGLLSKKISTFKKNALYFQNKYGKYLTLNIDTGKVTFKKSLSWFSLWEIVESTNKSFDIKQYGSEKYLSVNKTEHFIVVQKSERNSTWNLNMVNDSWALQNCNTMTYINMIDSKSTAMNSAVIPSTSFIIKIQQNPLSMKPKQIGKFYNLTNKYVLIKNMKEKYLSIKGKTNVQVDSHTHAKSYWKLLYSKSHDAYRFQAFEGGYFLAGKSLTNYPYTTSNKTRNTLWKFKFVKNHWALYNVLYKNYLRSDDKEVDFVSCIGELEKWDVIEEKPPLPSSKQSKKPIPVPIKTLPKNIKGKAALFHTPKGKYISASENGETIILTTIMEHSYWTIIEKQEEIFYIVSIYKTYLTLGSKGLYQSKTPKEGSKWKITIEGTNWAIQSAKTFQYISITDKEVFIFTKICHYWYFESSTTITTFITIYVEDPHDYLDTGLYIQSSSNLYLKYEDKKVSALANQDSLWKLKEAGKDLFYLSTMDNHYVHSSSDNKAIELSKEITNNAKWKIQIQNSMWIFKSELYGTYLSLSKKNKLICSKNEFNWQIKSISPTIFNRNIFIQDQKSKYFIGQELLTVKMLQEPTSMAYMMLQRRNTNIVSLSGAWNNYFTEINNTIIATSDLQIEGLWYIEEAEKGVTFKNGISGRYLFFNSPKQLATTSKKEKALWNLYLA